VLLIQLQRVKYQQFLQAQFLHAHDYFQYGEPVDVTACGLDPLGCPQKADSLEQDIQTAIQISVEGWGLKVELVLI
jgi:hypothetical protein